jgi:hypothetical protein
MQETPARENPSRSNEGDLPPWDRVVFAPPPAWTRQEFGYDATVRAKDGEHVTHLLWSWQVDAEAGQICHTVARRLETALAVQHEAQWRLDLDPGTSRLTLHWLRVVRGDVVIDQLKRERMRCSSARPSSSIT